MVCHQWPGGGRRNDVVASAAIPGSLSSSVTADSKQLFCIGIGDASLRTAVAALAVGYLVAVRYTLHYSGPHITRACLPARTTAHGVAGEPFGRYS